MVNGIRVRLADVLAKEFANSSFEDINSDSFYVWADHDWWMIPWYDLFEDYAAEESRLDVVAAGGSNGGEDAGASRKG